MQRKRKKTEKIKNKSKKKNNKNNQNIILFIYLFIVQTILENTRNPQYASEVQHEYEDKYLLAEFLANASIACHFSILEHLGVTGKPLEQVHSCLYSLFTIKTITYALLITLTSHFCSLSFIFLIFILFCYSLFYAYALCSIFSLLSLFISVLLYSFIPLFFYSFILVLSNISLVKRMGSKTKCNTQTNS